MIDGLYLPPKPAIIQAAEPWEIHAHAEMARRGIDRRARRAVLAEIKRLARVGHGVVARAEAAALSHYVGHDISPFVLGGMLINPYSFGIPAASISYRTYAEDTADLTTYNGVPFQGLDIGTAAANRYVILAVSGRINSASQTVSGVTIGGNAATKIVESTKSGSGTNHASIWVLLVTSGTTATIVVTYSAAGVRCEVGIWAAYGIDPAGYGTIASNANNGTGTISCPAGGIIVGGRYSDIAENQTWVGITEKYDASAEGGNGEASGASDAFATAQSGITVSCSGSTGTSCAMAVAAFAPG